MLAFIDSRLCAVIIPRTQNFKRECLQENEMPGGRPARYCSPAERVMTRYWKLFIPEGCVNANTTQNTLQPSSTQHTHHCNRRRANPAGQPIGQSGTECVRIRYAGSFTLGHRGTNERPSFARASGAHE